MGMLRSHRRERAESSRADLVGESALDQWPPEGAAADEFPWTAFATARTLCGAGSVEEAKRCWQEVVARPGLESRHYLQAWYFLRAHGERPPEELEKQVLGLVVEKRLAEGTDLLAVYSDGSARYDNYSGASVIVARAEGELSTLIDALLAAAGDVVAQIGPWEGKRRAPLRRGHVRLSFLTPNGVHLGEGPADAMENDRLGGLVLVGATEVMRSLVATWMPAG